MVTLRVPLKRHGTCMHVSFACRCEVCMLSGVTHNFVKARLLISSTSRDILKYAVFSTKTACCWNGEISSVRKLRPGPNGP